VSEFFALLSRIIVRREDFLLRIFPPRLGHESDRQAMCNLLLHMQQKVVIGLVAALLRCVLCRKKTDAPAVRSTFRG
jgi:hypothetical protein